MDLIRLGVNHMRSDPKGIHGNGCDCTCVICRSNGEDRSNARNMTYQSIFELWMSCVCPKQQSLEWHSLSCLLIIC